ncbi:Ebp2p SCDLUD_003965 [Saccharomycodes ludwigii]|uniref:Ebp2p n=1 Tax=Saccharomycodes ludwigii TaxID=36035 RepID=UPI001E847A00|nr:hypothetical protein SCDLUD_003965 [Saccharomycodes ludwigii]KAH3899682.1 hypothetical protein SCDLUD_003965 [Saccharomycodes ludwigii]
MAKGGSKLKKALNNQKELEKFSKEQQQKKAKRLAQLEKEASNLKVVTKEDLEKQQGAEKVKVPTSDEKELSEHGNKPLSKKEKRKLRKLQKKQEEAEKEILAEEEEEEEKEEEEEEVDDDEAEYEQPSIDIERLAKSDDEDSEEEEDDDSDDNDDEEEEEKEEEEKEEQDDDDDEEEQDADDDDDEKEEVSYSDANSGMDSDVVPHTKLTVNNKKALKASLERVHLPWEKHSFQEHQSITSSTPVENHIKDLNDETERELAFYKQSLDATLQARDKLKKLNVRFRRPLDYFAEMVKTDEHMDKLKQKLVKEASEKKAIEEARKQRQLKKFGKQVQVATLQQRQKDKRETMEKIKSLRKKRAHNDIDDSNFDVGVEDAIGDASGDASNKKQNKANRKRDAKNAKYGRGGMKRFKRKNDAESSSQIPEFSHKKMKSGIRRKGH